MNTIALGVIDLERGFMPIGQSPYTIQNGYGELPVPGGHEIINSVNLTMAAFAKRRLPIFTTQDWHPRETDHFSVTPDYDKTWPQHCVANTPGAELHHGLKIPAHTAQFVKGTEPLKCGAEDTSYSALYAHERKTKMRMADWLVRRHVTAVALEGVALDECVGFSALDFRKHLGLDVIIVSDAVRGITPESSRAMIAKLEAAGVSFTTSDELLRQLERA